jgi:hypothetical protein
MYKFDITVQEQLNKVVKDFKKLTSDAITETAIEIHGAIVRTSPVRTGLYRSNNFIEVDGQHENTETSTRQKAQRSREALNIRFVLGKNRSIHLFNNLVYADTLEVRDYGQSQMGVYYPASLRVGKIFQRKFKQKKFDFK